MSENLITEKRFTDLSNQAYKRDIVTFSDFLTPNEINILQQNTKSYVTSYELFGGYEFAERQIAAFVPDALSYIWKYPVDCIQICPAYPKFAESLSHRDILGAVMSLGIERDKTGDIMVKDSNAYLFCKREITDYILQELTQIRHTLIHCEIVSADDLQIKPELQDYSAIIASSRLDNVVSALCKISRSTAVNTIQSGKVSIQGKECLHNSYLCKPDDIISIRGFGKFRFCGEGALTKKNRIIINYKKYI